MLMSIYADMHACMHACIHTNCHIHAYIHTVTYMHTLRTITRQSDGTQKQLERALLTRAFLHRIAQSRLAGRHRLQTLACRMRKWRLRTARRKYIGSVVKGLLGSRQAQILKSLENTSTCWRDWARVCGGHRALTFQNGAQRQARVLLQLAFAALKRSTRTAAMHKGVDYYFARSLARGLLAHVIWAWCRQAQDQLIRDERSALGAAHTLRALAASHRGPAGAGGKLSVGGGSGGGMSPPVAPGSSSPHSLFTPPSHTAVAQSVGSPQSPLSGNKSLCLSPGSQAEEGAGGSGGSKVLARRANDKVKSKLSSYRHLLSSGASAKTSRSASQASNVLRRGADSDSGESGDGGLDEEVSRILGELRC